MGNKFKTKLEEEKHWYIYCFVKSQKHYFKLIVTTITSNYFVVDRSQQYLIAYFFLHSIKLCIFRSWITGSSPWLLLWWRHMLVSRSPRTRLMKKLVRSRCRNNRKWRYRHYPRSTAPSSVGNTHTALRLPTTIILPCVYSSLQCRPP